VRGQSRWETKASGFDAENPARSDLAEIAREEIRSAVDAPIVVDGRL